MGTLPQGKIGETSRKMKKMIIENDDIIILEEYETYAGVRALNE